MFFRRVKAGTPTFEERLQALRQAGFNVAPQGGGPVRIARGDCAALVEAEPGGQARVHVSGVVMGNEIAQLVDGGFQKFLLSAGGRRSPATAEQLKSLHNFNEDLSEALGLPSFYNTSLGTVCDSHAYDRVENRDQGVPRRPWER